MSLPVYVPPNTVLPWGAETEKPDYDYADGVTLRVFALDEGVSAAFTVAATNGSIAARGTVRRKGSEYAVEISEGALKNWCVDVDGKRSPVQAEARSLTWAAA